MAVYLAREDVQVLTLLGHQFDEMVLSCTYRGVSCRQVMKPGFFNKFLLNTKVYCHVHGVAVETSALFHSADVKYVKKKPGNFSIVGLRQIFVSPPYAKYFNLLSEEKNTRRDSFHLISDKFVKVTINQWSQYLPIPNQFQNFLSLILGRSNLFGFYEDSS